MVAPVPRASLMTRVCGSARVEAAKERVRAAAAKRVWALVWERAVRANMVGLLFSHGVPTRKRARYEVRLRSQEEVPGNLSSGNRPSKLVATS